MPAGSGLTKAQAKRQIPLNYTSRERVEKAMALGEDDSAMPKRRVFNNRHC